MVFLTAIFVKRLMTTMRQKHFTRSGPQCTQLCQHAGFCWSQYGWLWRVCRPDKLHSEQCFVKLLCGTTLIFIVRLDAKEGALDGKCMKFSRVERALAVMSQHFSLRSVSKHIQVTVAAHRSETSVSMFMWPLKVAQPNTWSNK